MLRHVRPAMPQSCHTSGLFVTFQFFQTWTEEEYFATWSIKSMEETDIDKLKNHESKNIFILQLLHLGSSQLFTRPRERWGWQVLKHWNMNETGELRWIQLQWSFRHSKPVVYVFDIIVICVTGICSVTMAIWCNLFRPSQSSRALGGCQGFCWAGWGST